jgi:cytochrome oxidase Cu insertion factor (SCO1/SenC/PrrC family)
MTLRRSLVPVLLLLALVGAAFAAGNVLEDRMMDLTIAPLEPQAPPALTVTTVDGVRLTLADARGKAVLVYFWATW